MAKIAKSSSKVNPFIGLIFCIDQLNESGIPTLIDDHLGKTSKTFGFDYSQTLLDPLLIYFNGGNCAEEISDHFRIHLLPVKGFSVCDADLILRVVNEQLATPILSLASK